MVADLNVHWDMGKDGVPKPHAQVMLSMREVDGEGFGKKVRDWNSTELVEGWREGWANQVNERLAERDIDSRIDNRTLHAQGSELEAEHERGPGSWRRRVTGRETEEVESQ